MVNTQLTTDIHNRLAGLRASLRRRLVSEAVAWMLTCLVVSVFVTLAFDYTLHMERPLRGMMMTIVAAAFIWTVYRRLIEPMLAPMNSDELALLVESRYTHIGDRLISAIQFQRGRNANESDAMVLHVMTEAGQMIGGIDMDCLVDRVRLRRVQKIGACFLMLLVGFSIWQSDIMSLWLQRNIAFSNVGWPQDTYLSVNDGPDFTVLRGDDLTVTIAAEGNVIPSEMILHVRYPSVGWTEERLELEPPSAGAATYKKVFDGVAEEFEFFVTGGDDSRDKRRKHQVDVIDPPVVSECNFVVEYPSYMNKTPREIKGSHGVLSAPVDATLRVTAKSTKPLRKVELTLDGKEVWSDKWSVASTPDGVISFTGRFDIKPIAAGAKGASAIRVLRFGLTDTEGHFGNGGQKYTIEVRLDRAPSVDLRKRAIRGVVTPMAIIPLTIKAEDDYGLATARVLLSVGARKLDKGRVDISLPIGNPRDVSLKRDVDLQGRGLAPGDKLTISVELHDTLPKRLGGPNIGRGGPLSLRVVKPEELMAELVRRQKTLRLEFVQAIALQRSARDGADATRAMLAGGKLLPEASRRIKAAASSQKSVGSECAKAAEVMSAVLQEMIYNRLGSGPEHQQMQSGIIAPLKALADPITKAAALLNQARNLKDASRIDRRIEVIVGFQGEILTTMGEILDQMRKLETRQDMINKLRLILKWSEQQLKDIEKERNAEAGNVLEDVPENTENEK